MGKISFRYILSATIILHNHALAAERKKQPAEGRRIERVKTKE